MQIEPIPDEERSHSEPYPALLDRLSRQSVAKHYDAYASIEWDTEAMRLDPDDPRLELGDEDPLGATAWYQAQPPSVRARIGLARVAGFMKVGYYFENALSRGLLALAARLPDGAPEFRYAYHEVIEESQHTLMFAEFVRRAGVDVAGVTGIWRVLGERVVLLGTLFPELFFIFILAGEDPIDFVQRRALRRKKPIHPLLRRIVQIHVTEEARHLCFARQYLREHVPALSLARRAALSLAAPVVLFATAQRMLQPPAALIERFAIPGAVVREAFGPRHRRDVAESLGKIRQLCAELGLLGPVAERLWRGLGLWA